MCIQLVLGLKPPWSGWIFDVWEDSLVRSSFSSTLLITGSSVIPLKLDGLVVSMFRPLGMGTIRPCWKEVGT